MRLTYLRRSGASSVQSAARAETTQQLIAQIEQRILGANAESRREIFDLQAKIDSSQQELEMAVGQLKELEQRINQLMHRIRLLTLCGIGAIVAVLASLLMTALVLAQVSR